MGWQDFSCQPGGSRYGYGVVKEPSGPIVLSLGLSSYRAARLSWSEAQPQISGS
jgi:hypothetical protein